MLHGSLGITLHHRPGHFSGQGHNPVIYGVIQIVEDAVIRNHRQFMAYLTGQILSGRVACPGKNRNRANG